MSTITLGLSDEVLGAIGLRHRKRLVQTRHEQYPLAAQVYRKKKTATGETLIMPFDTGRHSFPTRLVSGFEAYSRAHSPIITPGQVLPSFLCQPVFISAIDRAKNSGENRLVELAKSRIENVELDLDLQLTQVLFRGAPASGSFAGQSEWVGWNTLNGIDHSTGLLVAATSSTNTFNGLNLTNFPATTHPLFHPLWVDLNSQAGTNGLNAFNQIMIDLEIRFGKGMLTGGRFEWYVSRLFKNFIKRALRASERYTSDGSMDDARRTFDTFNGVPVIPTNQLAQNGATTATTKFSAVLIDWENLEPQFYTGWDKWMSPWTDISGLIPGTQVCVFLIGGNFVFGPGGSFASMTNGEVY